MMSPREDATRVAIVTGGSRGIGHAIVARLAADGYAVVVGYAGNREEAEAAVTDITGSQPGIRAATPDPTPTRNPTSPNAKE
jgi:3-oxoacyl-[acyl-carrier protein] reductase